MAYFAMTKLALKAAFSSPVTRQYPFQPRRILPGSRGQLLFRKETCVFCTVCAKKCPTAALVVNRAQKKWAIDRLQCISCGACVDVCPKDSLALTTEHGVPSVTKDREWH